MNDRALFFTTVKLDNGWFRLEGKERGEIEYQKTNSSIDDFDQVCRIYQVEKDVYKLFLFSAKREIKFKLFGSLSDAMKYAETMTDLHGFQIQSLKNDWSLN